MLTESNRINRTTTNANTEESIFTTTDSYATLTSNTEDYSTVDEGIIVQSYTDSFGISNTTDILNYPSTEPIANAGTQYTTETSTTERIETETENLLLTGSILVETTTTSNTQHSFNPTTPDIAAFITQFGHVQTSVPEDTERTTELTTESFGFPTNTAQGPNFPNYSTTESITEKTIFATTDSYTTLTFNTEDSSTVYEGINVQSSTDSFGIANTTDILNYSSTESATAQGTNFPNYFTTKSVAGT